MADELPLRCLELGPGLIDEGGEIRLVAGMVPNSFQVLPTDDLAILNFNQSDGRGKDLEPLDQSRVDGGGVVRSLPFQLASCEIRRQRFVREAFNFATGRAAVRRVKVNGGEL